MASFNFFEAVTKNFWRNEKKKKSAYLQYNIPKHASKDTWLQRDSNPQPLIRKQTLNHLVKLAKCLSCVVSTYLYDSFDFMFLSCHVRVSERIHTL